MFAAAVAVGAGDGVGVEIDDAVATWGAVGHRIEVVIFEVEVLLLEGVFQEGEQRFLAPKEGDLSRLVAVAQGMIAPACLLASSLAGGAEACFEMAFCLLGQRFEVLLGHGWWPTPGSERWQAVIKSVEPIVYLYRGSGIPFTNKQYPTPVLESGYPPQKIYQYQVMSVLLSS